MLSQQPPYFLEQYFKNLHSSQMIFFPSGTEKIIFSGSCCWFSSLLSVCSVFFQPSLLDQTGKTDDIEDEVMDQIQKTGRKQSELWHNSWVTELKRWQSTTRACLCFYSSKGNRNFITGFSGSLIRSLKAF